MISNVPKVSVIVPVYNVENYLGKCLDSLIGQTLDEIEILVVNDGCTDGSQAIIERYREQFPEKVFSFIKENGGLSDARNYGIDRARGEYLAFVDSDDYVTPHMMAEMYGLAQKHRAEIVICNLQKVDEQGNVTQQLTQLPNFPERIELEKNLSVFSDISYFACNKLFKRELFDGMRFRKGLHFEDIELIPRVLLKAEIIAFCPENHYQYLERTNSISKSHTLKGLDILEAANTVKKAFLQSRFQNQHQVLKNFLILEGFYTFLAYLAFVKNRSDFLKMSKSIDDFCKENQIKVKDILRYKRFNKNYLLSLPLGKKIYYTLYLLGLRDYLRLLIQKSI